MPELPEVEGYRKYITGTALHQPITAIHTFNEGRMLPQGLEALKKTTLRSVFVDTSRIGKYLFLHLNNDQLLMWHFGLTGVPVYYQGEDLRPKYTRIQFSFDNGFYLAFACLRKFGKLHITESVEAYRKQYKIGEDALKISRLAFIQALTGKKTMIKSTLLDQTHFAGVGNWIADEMLHRTRIHPETRTFALTESDYARLHTAMQDIMETAIQLESDNGTFPPGYLAAHRTKGGTCPRCGAALERLVVGGRGTYICTPCLGKSPNV